MDRYVTVSPRVIYYAGAIVISAHWGWGTLIAMTIGIAIGSFRLR